MIARFDVLHPADLDELLSLLAEEVPGTCLLAGGTDLLVQIRRGVLAPSRVIALKQVPGLDRLAFDDDGGLGIGATVLLAEMADHPEVQRRFSALAHAAARTANVQVRNMGTVVGNLCNASPCADNAPTLLAMGAVAQIASSTGRRAVPLGALFRGPGSTTLRPDELVTQVTVPSPPARSGAAYDNMPARGNVDLTAVSAGVYLELNQQQAVRTARIVLGAVAPVPLRVPDAEALLQGQPPDHDTIERAANEAAQQSQPIDDLRASADFRRDVVGVLTARALRRAADQAIASDDNSEGRP